MPHNITYRVYYEDTDAAGVVYYANYLKFAERARTEALRAAGFNQSQLLEKDRVAFAVARVEMDYRKPMRLDDVVEVETILQELKVASMNMRQILRVEGVIVAEGLFRLACVDSNLKPRKMPEDILNSMRNLLEKIDDR